MIFLIDDDDIQNLINHRMLELVTKSYSVRVFSGGEAALEALKNDEVQPRLIFLDINMPRMNGWDFMDQYEAASLTYPVFILTSSINNLDKEKSWNYKSVKGLLSKPLTTEMVRQVLSDLDMI